MTLEDSSVPFTDADSRRAVVRSLRNVGIAVVVVAPLLWWKLGWASSALFVIGAVISGSGIFEWLRLMTAITARMDADPNARPRPVAPVLAGFFLRLGGALVLLYVSDSAAPCLQAHGICRAAPASPWRET